ncbi:hypothetical protein PpBr36_07169 [Pyricularia pennisetigena]|uniref:hypothetical protein n=1 Tax=Pyricularia pennisetigena TaxID=1578925 RepID=UPI00114FCF48|nr:hypothetical protein PpBr36_07169 [Pyricularia pennisetigena]TLS25236.1 hypothetical protein PpBr36_07169 [Pyricularia pennisetigena]
MAARKFKADVLAAAANAAAGRINNVSSVRRGDDDEVIVTYFNEQLPKSLQVRLLAANVDGYPGPCNFLLFTDDEEAPRQVAKVLEQVQTHFATGGSFTITRAITYLSKNLDKCLGESLSLDSPNSSDAEMTDADEVNDNSEEEEDDDCAYDSFGANATDDEADDDGFFAQMGGSATAVPTMNPQLSHSQLKEQERIRASLRKAKRSGCKIGVLAGLLPGHNFHIFSMSVRICKLGLSEENLLAWGLSDSDYLVLLVSITGTSFPTMESIMERPAAHSGMKFRIRKCANFKPTTSQAVKAFNEAIIRDDELEGTAPDSSADPPLERIFLSRSFDEFMSESFVSLVKLRENLGYSWDEANESLINGISNTADLNRQFPSDQATKMNDHLASGVRTKRSVPLICWEFAMKYFKDCTKYCIRCHRLVRNDVGSLKPFVCSNQLCLFQYMQMGLGPSVEHEILSQPKVVDLLCSFCYSSTLAVYLGDKNKYSIREFPVGLSLKVPGFFGRRQSSASLPSCIPVRVTDLDQGLLLDTYDHDDWLASLKPGVCCALVNQVTLLNNGFTLKKDTFSSKLETRYIRPTWVQKGPNDPWASPFTGEMNAHMESITYGNVVSIDRNAGTVVISVAGRRCRAVDIGAVQETDPRQDPAQLFLATFDTSFDTLLDDGKAMAIRFILDMLPPIAQIRTFLKKNPNSSVTGMSQVLPPAATLLEWIVATNRSLIMCLEEEDDIDPTMDVTPSQSLALLKIPEMSGYVQFRFAQGSPDKEERFRTELNRMGAAGSKHPTIFGWHGSNQSNWHSIIRTGLDFNDVANGRAYGNGVYFSQELNTSMGYAHLGTSFMWPSSALQSNRIIVLSELINIPDEFVSRSPHLVVQNIDWQQCRYLFVQKPSALAQVPPALVAPSATCHMTSPSMFIEQDPNMIPRGADHRPLRIPRAAIPSSGSQMLPTDDDGYESEDDDLDVLTEVVEISSDEEEVHTGAEDYDTEVELLEARTIKPDHLTDFQPGTLDLASLPRLAPPQRSGGAGRHLAKEISVLRKIQEATPSHELGWYIDFDGMSNMFQMIVELHSFDKTKPLGRSMATRSVNSIVMELRFGENFPISPPFVRVIRPRFLPFHAGGGGHVTLGGAMCMELLTSSGWSPACSIEHVLIMVRLALVSEDPQPAQIEHAGGGDYDIGGAVVAYRRAAMVHGWQIPPDLDQTAMGAGSASA